MALVGIPTDKVDGILEFIPVGLRVARFDLVPFPGIIQCLCIAKGAGNSGTGNETEPSFAGRFGIRSEFGFLVNDGQLDVHGGSPFFFGRTQASIPIIATIQENAGLINIGWNRGTTGQNGEEQPDRLS